MKHTLSLSPSLSLSHTHVHTSHTDTHTHTHTIHTLSLCLSLSIPPPLFLINPSPHPSVHTPQGVGVDSSHQSVIAGPSSMATPGGSSGVTQGPSGPMPPHPMSSQVDGFHSNHGQLPQFTSANLSHYPRSKCHVCVCECVCVRACVYEREREIMHGSVYVGG